MSKVKKRAGGNDVKTMVLYNGYYNDPGLVPGRIARIMDIIQIKVLRGPNYWSNARQKLIVLKLDIGHYERRPSDQVPLFADNMLRAMPTLTEHHCSFGREGGFVERVREGTWAGHIVEHVALELQTLAGMPCTFGRTRSVEERPNGVYHVAFAYQVEEAGVYAAKAAVRIVGALLEGEEVSVHEDIAKLAEIFESQRPGPSTQALIDEAERRGIPVEKVDGSLLLFGQGKSQKWACASMTGATSGIGVDIVSDKSLTKRLLHRACVPVPLGLLADSAAALASHIKALGYPLAIKPVNGNHGKGVATNIRSWEQAWKAFQAAQSVDERVLVERFVEGNDYRLLVVGHRLVAAAHRRPARIVGDGVSTIAQLIAIENARPERGPDHARQLTFIQVTPSELQLLEEGRWTLDAVLPLHKELKLKDAANLSSGGTASDVTDELRPDWVTMAERISRILRLDICGIDVVAKSLEKPLDGHNGCVIEVNACPGLRMHLFPESGKKRDVGKAIMDMLYPEGQGRIPIVAVTGTNGKTTTVRLTAYMAQMAGKTPGYVTTDGIYVGRELIEYGDCSGPSSARTVLIEPTVDYAVLECARGGILRSGLGFDQCDIAVVTNVSEDHLGLEDIETLQDLARVKSVVPHSVRPGGFAILNADDQRVYAMKDELGCHIALFGLDADNPRLRSHVDSGGLAAFVENGQLCISEGYVVHVVLPVRDVPLSFSGTSIFMVQNVLAATLAGYIAGWDLEVLRASLSTFYPSPEMTPGRMNNFDFGHCQVLLDYVHNEGGFREMKTFMEAQAFPRKQGVIFATGDRKARDIIRLGAMAADIFDAIVINEHHDARGTPPEELTALLIKGIQSVKPWMQITLMPGERAALAHALQCAQEGECIFVCVDDVRKSLGYAYELQAEWRLVYDREKCQRSLYG